MRHVSKPVLGQFFLVYLFFYFFASLGGLLFGGDLTFESYKESGAPVFYYLMNFNDYGSALVTLFHQMIINNWFITVNMFVAIKGDSNMVRLFFVNFWIFTVLIMFNTFIAIILEIHSSVTEIVRERYSHSETKQKLADKLMHLNSA